MKVYVHLVGTVDNCVATNQNQKYLCVLKYKEDMVEISMLWLAWKTMIAKDLGLLLAHFVHIHPGVCVPRSEPKPEGI